jgi:RNA polymerase sigma-70 factor (ECF subfamily)
VRLDAETAAGLRNAMVGWLRRRTSDAALAEDLAQEAFVHVLRGFSRYRGAAALRTWARRITQNVWRDHLRRTAVRPEGHLEPSVCALLDALDPRHEAAPAAYDRRLTHECLLAATRHVPPGPRRVLLLHDFGDMPLEDVAAALDCSTATARVRLHRARKRLGEVCRADCACEVAPDGVSICAPKRPRRAATTRDEAHKPTRRR